MRIHETPKARRRARVAAIAIGAILLLADWFFVPGDPQPHGAGDKIGRSVLIAILLLVLDLVVEIYMIVDGSASEVDDELLAANKFMLSNPNAMASLHLGAILRQLRGALKVQSAERSYVIDNRSLAIDTYCSFWQMLAEKQEDIFRRHKKKPPPKACLEVRAIHATSIGIWLDENSLVTKEVLRAHRRFTDAGGRITRIILARSEAPDGEYMRAIQNMVKNGASVGYLQVNFGNHHIASRWDFMIVGEGAKFERGDDSLEALIWAQADEGTGTPLKAVYSLNGRYSEHPNPLRETWQMHRDQVNDSSFWRPAPAVNGKAKG